MSADAGNFTTIIAGGLGQLVSGLGNIIQNFVMVGSVGFEAFRKLGQGILAHYAGSFAIKAIDNIAEGISNLAKASAAAAQAALGNPMAAAAAVLFKKAAMENFASAAKYGLGAVGFAAAGVAIGGGGGKADGGAGRSFNAAGTEQEPREKKFNYGSDGTRPASDDLVQGSRGIFARMEAAMRETAATNRELRAEISTLRTQPAGVVVREGASDARGAISVAVLEHQNENQAFTNEFLRNARAG
jgi:hypothetical protein